MRLCSEANRTDETALPWMRASLKRMPAALSGDQNYNEISITYVFAVLFRLARQQLVHVVKVFFDAAAQGGRLLVGQHRGSMIEERE
jgi:hypothetical protein